jgi:hypothetical protein
MAFSSKIPMDVGLFEEILLNYFERNRYITVHPHAIIEQ